MDGIRAIIDRILDNPDSVPQELKHITQDLVLANLLSRILYYSCSNGSYESHWVSMSISDWQQELYITHYATKTSIKRLESLGLILTSVYPDPDTNLPITHIKANLDALEKLFPNPCETTSVTTTNTTPDQPYVWVPSPEWDGSNISIFDINAIPNRCENAPVAISNQFEIKQVIGPNQVEIAPVATQNRCENEQDDPKKLSDNSKIFPRAPVNVNQLKDLKPVVNTNTINLTESKNVNGFKPIDLINLIKMLASLAGGQAAKNFFSPAAVEPFAPTMQADLSFVAPTQPTLLDLPLISESTQPPDASTEKITIRNKINPPKLPDFASCNKPARSKKTKAPSDPLLKAPAVMVYRGVACAQMAACMRQMVVETVGSDYKKVELWGKIVKEWIGSGYNPRNIIGMLEAFKAGGLSKNGNSNRNGNNKTTPADVHYAPSDPVEHMKSITPPDIWEKLGGDVRLAQAWQQVHYNPRWRKTILKNDVEELKAVGVDRF